MSSFFAMAYTCGQSNAVIVNVLECISSPKETPTTLTHGERRVGMIGENVV
jgi:hypothetical protein